MKSITRTALVLTASLAPTLASAALSVSVGLSFGSGGTCFVGICGIANTILYLINDVFVPVLFAVAFLVFIYGVYKSYIYSHGEPAEIAEGHKAILWGLIGFAVMISLWGLVNVVANTFGLGGVGAPPLPTSYSAY